MLSVADISQLLWVIIALYIIYNYCEIEGGGNSYDL